MLHDYVCISMFWSLGVGLTWSFMLTSCLRLVLVQFLTHKGISKYWNGQHCGCYDLFLWDMFNVLWIFHHSWFDVASNNWACNLRRHSSAHYSLFYLIRLEVVNVDKASWIAAWSWW
jgi:hypothetical protein